MTDSQKLFSMVSELTMARKKQKLSFMDVAKKMGVSKSQVWSYENYTDAFNGRLPTLWSAMKWADALGYEIILKKRK